MSLIVTVTNAGYAALAAAQAGGTGPLVIAKVGVSPTAVTPLPTMTALAGEIKRITTISGLATDPKTVHITVSDETLDAYTVKSFGLYLTDGTLFALYGQTDAVIIKTASSLMLLSIDIAFAAVASAALTFGDANFVNPDATEVTKGVMALATNAEASSGTVPNKAITPKTLAFTLAAWLIAQFSDVWRASNDGAGSGLDAGLFAGQLPAYYTNIPGRQGFTSANKAGDMFTGPVYFQDANFFTTFVGGNPIIVLDGGDSITYDRVNNTLTVAIGSAGKLTVNPAGVGVGGTFTSTGAATVQGGTVWHSANDGAGSGLDAGLFGGQLPAYYMAITARLGYTPANKAGDTFSGPVGFGDGQHYLAMSGPNPIHQFDLNDFIAYDRGSDVLRVVVSGADRLQVAPTGAAVYGTLQVTGQTLIQGGLTWHSANDGAGSGLDAGLFAGQLPAYYQQNIYDIRSLEVGQNATSDGSSFLDLHASAGVDYSARLVREAGLNGNLSLVQAGTGLISLTGGTTLVRDGNTIWHAGNDGAGSGSDADLLDGQQGAFYTDIASRLGYTPLNQVSYTASDILAKLVTVDGAGSALDADLLDGKQAADFVLKSSIMADFASAMSLTWANSFSNNSFRLGNLLVQTGIVSGLAVNGVTTVNLPTDFSLPPFVFFQRRTSGAVTNADSGAGLEGTPTTHSFNVRNTTSGAIIDVMWVAFGPAA